MLLFLLYKLLNFNCTISTISKYYAFTIYFIKLLVKVGNYYLRKFN